MLLLLLFVIVLAALASWLLGQHVQKKHPPVGAFMEVNGVQLHYLDSAAAKPGHDTSPGSNSDSSASAALPTIVLLHGATGNLLDWTSSLFGPLAEQYRVIAFDRPGLGYSERATGAWSDPHQQAELIRLALQQLGVEKPILLGHSWSGALVLDYLVHHQAEVQAAVLLSPVSHAWPGGVTWYNYVQAVPIAREILTYSLLPVLGWLGVDSGIREVTYPSAVPPAYRDKIGLDLFFRPQVMLNNFQDLRLLCEFVTKLSIRYPEITTPVQIISGTPDTVVYSWNHSQRLHRELQAVQWLDIADAGHAPHHTHTQLVLDTIMPFLAKTLSTKP